MKTLQEMTHEKWTALTPDERERLRDLSNLSPQLIGLEGCRVEVIDGEGTRRFNVGRSTGWRPCHLEIHNRRCLGGYPAQKEYKSVKIVRRS